MILLNRTTIEGTRVACMRSRTRVKLRITILDYSLNSHRYVKTLTNLVKLMRVE